MPSERKPASKRRQFYALGLRGWVEIREATRLPRLMTSTMTITAEEPYVLFDAQGKARTTRLPTPKTITFSNFTGGRLVCSVEVRTFMKLTKKVLGRDQCIKLGALDVRALKLEAL